MSKITLASILILALISRSSFASLGEEQEEDFQPGYYIDNKIVSSKNDPAAQELRAGLVEYYSKNEPEKVPEVKKADLGGLIALCIAAAAWKQYCEERNKKN